MNLTRMEKRRSQRVSSKDKVKFLKVTELGDICAYIPKDKPDIAVLELVGDFPKTKEGRNPIVVDRKQLLKFFVLPGDVKKAKKDMLKKERSRISFFQWMKKLFTK